ncbi:MAG: AIM24 family protein [Bryobacteraceae bacterium]
MFCTHCGSRVPDGANFCVGCGAQVNRGAPVASPVPAPPGFPPPAPLVSPAAVHLSTPVAPGPAARHKCRWCGMVSDGAQLSCPGCGATIDQLPTASRSGWAQLPGRKDMAKLQFGNSFCQIEGNYVPVADMNLAAGDGIFFTHHVLLWKDAQVAVTTMPLAGGWKRMFAGLPLIMTQAQGPGHIAFSRDAPGEMIALPIQPGQSIDVREHLFMIATSNLQYDWFSTGVWFVTQGQDNDTETHYPVGMFMDRFAGAQTPGLLLLHAAGNVLVRELAPNQTILVKPTSLIFKDPSVQMALHFEHPRTGFTAWGAWGNRYMWLRLWGPGRVAIQSVFDRVEAENQNVSSYSPATSQQW